jgi:hypothetical protein
MSQEIVEIKNQIELAKKNQEMLEKTLLVLVRQEDVKKDTDVLVANQESFVKVCSIYKKQGYDLSKRSVSDICNWAAARVKNSVEEVDAEEVFKDMTEFDGFEISNKAVIRNKITKEVKILIYDKHSKKFSVQFCIKGTVTQRRLHILVAKSFVPNSKNLKSVRHIDRNTKNNCPLNLEWFTAYYNKK